MSSIPGFQLRLTIAILLALSTAGLVHASGGDRPLVSVNGVVLYESDLSCAVEASMARQLISGRDHRREEGSTTGGVDLEATLKRLIAIELLYQESLKHRFPGLVEETEARYQREVERLGSEKKLASALECNDMTTEEFRKSIFRNLSINRLLEREVYSRVEVTENEIKDYYEKNSDKFRTPGSLRVKQIMIRTPSEHGEEEWRHAESKANRIYSEVSTGGDFDLSARRHSDDPSSASIGGDMGSIPVDSAEAEFGTVIVQTNDGTVTRPIRSHRGFHIIKVESRTPPSTRSLEEVRQKVITLVRREKIRIMTADLVNQLKTAAKIEILKSDEPEPGSREE